jgi:hypothetical protein
LQCGETDLCVTEVEVPPDTKGLKSKEVLISFGCVSDGYDIIDCIFVMPFQAFHWPVRT